MLVQKDVFPGVLWSLLKEHEPIMGNFCPAGSAKPNAACGYAVASLTHVLLFATGSHRLTVRHGPALFVLHWQVHAFTANTYRLN